MKPTLEMQLITAIYNQNADELIALIDRGCDVNCRNERGETALQYAVYRMNRWSVQEIIDAGANIEEKCLGNGKTALHISVRYKFVKMTKMLIDKGANVFAKDINGRTPLHIAAMKNSVGIAKLLLDNGADVNALDVYNATPYDDMVKGKFAHREDVSELRSLLESHGGKMANHEMIHGRGA